MADPTHGSARQEAERLVATALAAATLAAGRLGASPTGAGGFATGEPQCCVCPICRVVAAMRDPSPEFAERLATGAGDFAAGLASLLRAFGDASGGTGRADRDAEPDHEPDSESESNDGHGPADGDPWAAATRAAGAGPGPADDPNGHVGPGRPIPVLPQHRKPMAKKAVKRPVRRATVADDAVEAEITVDRPGGSAAGAAGQAGPPNGAGNGEPGDGHQGAVDRSV